MWVVLAPALAAWARRSPLLFLAGTAATVWAADLISFGLKQLVDRPRPFEVVRGVDTLMHASGPSFPSGHATTAFAGAVLLGSLVRRALPALLLLATAIAFSRVYVGVHYPLDVLAGAALGTAVALVAIALLRAPRPPSGRLRRSA